MSISSFRSSMSYPVIILRFIRATSLLYGWNREAFGVV
jgi:hypothetical protein